MPSQRQNFEITKYSDPTGIRFLRLGKIGFGNPPLFNPSDFQAIKETVQTIDFNTFEVYCLLQNRVVATILGVVEQKVETLFLSPDYFGKKLGKKLMDFANELHADKVDVKEQNTKAVDFCQGGLSVVANHA